MKNFLDRVAHIIFWTYAAPILMIVLVLVVVSSPAWLPFWAFDRLMSEGQS